MDSTFDREGLLGLLTQVGAELEAEGLHGQVFLVGGAALALAYDARRLTRDVDGMFEPKTRVYEAAARVARRNGLDDEWLNDSVKGLMPGRDAGQGTVMSVPGLDIQVASPEYLLAMKVAAARTDRDYDDIRFLIGECGFTTVGQVLESVERTWGSQAPYVLRPKSRFIVEQIIDEMRPPGRGVPSRRRRRPGR